MLQLRWYGMLNGKREKKSARIALCGLFAALSLCTMLMGSILPASTFSAPAFAGIFLVAVAVEYGMKTGFLLYAAVGVLSLLLIPDKEMALVFICFLGFYPLVKAYLEKIHFLPVRVAAKLILFNGCILSMYALILLVFPLPAVQEEFASMGIVSFGILLGAGNITFFLYDLAVARMVALYCAKLRPRLLRML